MTRFSKIEQGRAFQARAWAWATERKSRSFLPVVVVAPSCEDA